MLEIQSGSKLKIDNTKPSRYDSIDDPILEKMQRQYQITDSINE